MSRDILFIESTHEMGGVEFSTLFLASHLDPAAWNATVVCPREGRLASACRAAGLKVEIVPLPGLFSTSFRVGKGDTRLPNPLAWAWNGILVLVAATRLRSFLVRTRPDLVLTKGLYAHLCGGLAARWVGVKCIWHLQDFISERFWGLNRAFFGLLGRALPVGIVADGTPIIRQLPARLQQQARVVLNGVDVQNFRPDLEERDAVRRGFGFSPNDLVIGHAARLTPWKGQHHLLDAFGTMVSRQPQARLLLVGAATFDDDHYEQRLRARVQELGIDQRVVFAGFRADLAQVLASMDIFAYPSVEKDTSPLSLLSAMACGLPVVAFDIEGVREVLNAAGVLVPVRDECRLVEALESLVKNASQRRRLGQQSRETAVAQFNLERYTAGMEAVLRDAGTG